MKSISAINPASWENKESSIVKACTPVINKVEGVLLDYGTSLGFVSSYFEHLVTFQAKNSIRRAPASPALTKSCTEAMKRVSQIIIYTVREKGMEHKGE